MTETPVQNVQLPVGEHGALRNARVAEGEGWSLSITDHIDAYGGQRQEYRMVIGSHVATVSVMGGDSIASVSNQVGQVRGPEGQALGQHLVQAIKTAISSGGISPEELNILASPTASIASIKGIAGRTSRTRSSNLDM